MPEDTAPKFTLEGLEAGASDSTVSTETETEVTTENDNEDVSDLLVETEVPASKEEPKKEEPKKDAPSKAEQLLTSLGLDPKLAKFAVDNYEMTELLKDGKINSKLFGNAFSSPVQQKVERKEPKKSFKDGLEDWFNGF